MPASLTYPGVYIEELPSNVHTIAGVATSIAAFIGWAPQGPTDKAVLVQSFTQYQSIFGGFTPGVYLAYAVSHFFANGGAEAYIIRLVWDGSLTPAPGTNPAVSATALAVGVGFPAARITASVGAVPSPAVTVDVGAPVLQSLVIAPATLTPTANMPPLPALPPIPQGTSLGFSARGVYADGSWNPPGSPVQWSSSDSAILAIDPSSGVATGMSGGQATITAVCGRASASLTVSVSAAGLAPLGAPALVVTPASPSQLPVGATLQLTAVAQYLDGTQQDVTAFAAWSSSDASKAMVGQAGSGAPGLVTAKGASGSATITAAFFSVGSPPTPCEGSVTVPTAAKAITAVAVYPANATATVAQKVSYSGVVTYSDGTTDTVTSGSHPAGATLNWSTSPQSVASVDASGEVTLNAIGSAMVTLAYADGSTSVSASAPVVGTSATLNAISVTPVNPTVASGLPLQLSALGIYPDGSTVDLTHSVEWSPTTAVGANSGLVKSTTQGAVAVTATVPWQNTTHATANVTIAPPVIASIAITNPSPLASGQSVTLTATATMSDGSTQSPVPGAVWSSSAPWIVSVTPTGFATAIASGGSLTLFASSPGAWGNNLRVSVLRNSSDPTRFGLVVQQKNPSGQLSTLESFASLSTTPTDPQYAVTVIDNNSNYITFVDPATNAPVLPTSAPSPTSSPVALSGGADGATLFPASDQNFEQALLNPIGGVNLLDRVDIFNILCVPGETDEPTISQLQAYCADNRAMLIVDAPQIATPAGLASTGPVGTNHGAGVSQLPNAANSAYYFPWVLAPDPAAGNRPTPFPPCGFVAGVIAKTDAARGVWKAPAGVNAGLTRSLGLQFTLTDPENGNLNPQAINCLRQFKTYGDVVWGARTLAGANQVGSEWKYVPIRRLALYLESSLYEGTQWVVFEPNDEPLWGQIRLNVGAFMQGLFLEGAFAGSTPQKAYFVKCDADNNPSASVALGVVNILVGFAPLYPAEFVVIQIQQIQAQGS